MPVRPLLAAQVALVATVSAGLLLGSPAAGASAGWTWPVEGEILTGYRNGDDPYAGGQHRGIDIAAEAGTPVAAAVGGTVRFAGVAGSSGLTVSVRTADGRYDTSYLHLADAGVREGDRVDAGQRLGSVGTSGRRSAERSHLHFGVRDAGSRHAYRDPLSFLPPVAPGPAPEPRGGPLPVPGPVPAAPAPVRDPSPVRSPEGRRVRVPSGRRVRVPAGRRVRVPGGGRLPIATPALVPVGAPAAPPATAQQPVNRARVPGAESRRAPVPQPNTVPRPAELASPAPGPRAPATAPREGGGPDIGWALACVGLLLAAALLGRPGEGQRAPRGAAPRLRSLLRPLTGRR